MNAIKTIQDLLPNEHILNFYEGPLALPEWLGMGLRLMMGAGDLDQAGVLNVQKFSMFDVFFCQPWDNEGSLRKNVEYLVKNYYHKKIICFLDISDPKHMKNFCELFRNRFSLIDGFSMHTPHLSLDCIKSVLMVGGTAVNIDELNHNVVFEPTLKQVCEKPSEGLTKEDILIFNGIIDLKLQEKYGDCFKRIFDDLSNKSPIQVDMSLFSEENPLQNFNLYRILIAKFLKFDSIPSGLSVVFRANTRIWEPGRIYNELVITKVSEGGNRKGRKRNRKTRKMRKARK